MFFYHYFFPFGIECHNFFIITYFLWISLQKSTFNIFLHFIYNFGSPHGMYEFRGTFSFRGTAFSFASVFNIFG